MGSHAHCCPSADNSIASSCGSLAAKGEVSIFSAHCRQALTSGTWPAVGSVPMRWYKDEEHIGYDRDAKKIARKARQDRLDALLARNDSGKAFRTIYDEYNDEDIVLSKEELQMVQRIREGRFPHVEVGHSISRHLSHCAFTAEAHSSGASLTPY